MINRTIIAVGAVAVLLIGISLDDCLAETQTPPPANPGPRMALFPDRYKCLDLLELEKIKVNPQDNTITFDDPNLAGDYLAVTGWLKGWFSAWNHHPGSDGNVTKGAKTFQIMGWILVIVEHIRQKP